MSSNLILPTDPDFYKPLVMGDGYDKTPKQAAIKYAADADKERGPGGAFKYAASQVATFPDAWVKTAQATGVSNVMTQPMWFSPLHTPQNWQIASKRREVYQWINLLTADSVVLTSNFTFKKVFDLDKTSSYIIQDEITNGLLYENWQSEPIVDGTGLLKKPKRFGIRECFEKRSFEFSVHGFWRTYKCTEEHPLYVLDGDAYRLKKKTENNVKKIFFPNNFINKKQAHEVNLNDYLLAPIPHLGKISLTAEKAWMIGLNAADGCNCASKSSCSISFTMDKNEVLIPEIQKELKAFKGHVASRQHGKENGWRVSASTKEAYDFFNKYIKNKKTKKQFSSEVFKLDKESRLHLLGGYFDGDGSSVNDSHKLVANNYSCDMADQIYWLLLSVGIHASLGKYWVDPEQHYKTDSEWYYRIFIPQSDALKLKPYMRSNKVSQFTPKKTRELRFFYEEDGAFYYAQPIRDIRQFLYTGPGYDLEIKPKHSFVANGFITSNCRFFYENEPKVAAAIDFYSRFPMNSFELECPDPKILSFFKHHVVKKLNLNERFKEISSEYFMMGDVFAHTDISCELCKGTSIDPDTGEVCDHPGGMFSRIFIMNPDWIEVQRSPLTDEPLIVLIPDEELQQIVHKRSPKAIYDRIPDSLKQLILARAPIPLSNRTTSHLKHMGAPYGTYGTSLIRRLFTTLAYKTKIMTANWIVAERLILPVRVVKIGSDERPATSADIADIQNQLAATANDPNLTIVTHHNFEYEWYGTSGKVLQITQEMEHIDKELLDGLMLNQALLNGEMGGYNCHDEETEVLTDDGFKTIDLMHEEDKIMCFDKTSSCIRLEFPQELHIYDYDGEMIHFENKRMDIKITPNHKMLISKDKNKWDVIDAKKVKPSTYFRGIPDGFESSIQYPVITIDDKFMVEVGNNLLELENFVKLAGYYLSEGTISNTKSSHSLRVYQSKKKQLSYANISKTFENIEYNTHVYNYRNDEYQFVITSKTLVEFMLEHFGHGASTKSIPDWVKNLPAKYLETLITAMCEGDGHKRSTQCDSWLYSSTSEQMIDDLQEVTFKCGYSTRKYNNGPQGLGTLDLFRLHLSKGEGSNGSYPFVKKQHITKVHYTGKVWCFATSTGFFVTRRNGKIAIQGNSAQVGVETLIRRIESWRSSLAEWAQERIFRPIAEMQGFVDEEKSEEVGEKVFLYPTIKWNDLELKDKTQYHQMLNQLHDKQLISSQTMLDEIGLNYDQEVKRMRYEQAQLGPAGAMMGGAGDMAGGMGGGGMPGGAGSPAQMGMGGGEGGMPGAPMGPGGGMGMGGGDMGGGAGGGAMAEGGGKITKRGKNKQQEEEQVIPMLPIKLTKIEQKMAGMLEDVANTMGFNINQVRMQFPFENPKGGKAFTMDFAIPALKMDLEVDGEVWHSSQEQVADDSERDYLLAQRGWTVLRFDDKSVEEATQQVMATINSYIQKAIQANSKKTASSHSNGHVPGYFISSQGELKDLSGENNKYYTYLEKKYKK